MENTPNKRSLQSFFSSQRTQLKTLFVVLGIGLSLVAMKVAWLLFHIQNSVHSMVESQKISSEAGILISHSIIEASMVSLSFIFVVVLFILVFGLVQSHRIFGPIIPIRTLLSELKNGNYSARGKLRAKDEFQELMKVANDLATTLEERHGGKKL